MGIIEIAQKIKGGGCPRVTQQKGNEIKFNGAKVGIPEFSVNVESISNKIKEFYKVSQVTVAMDNNQFLLCDQISRLDNTNLLKDELIRIRLQLIMSFSNLHGIIAVINEANAEQIKQDLDEWIKYMHQLNMDCIASIRPKSRSTSTDDVAIKLSQNEINKIMEYQGSNKDEMNKAINILKE